MGNHMAPSSHKVIDEKQNLFMILDYCVQILKLKLLVSIKFNHIINYIPVLLHEIALVDVVSDEREAHAELFYFRLV